VIFISLMFWTWLWGIPGALSLDSHADDASKYLCDHFKSRLRLLESFLSG
jgi:hypothetical protein